MRRVRRPARSVPVCARVGAIALFTALPGVGSAQSPNGAEFRVNAYTTGDQRVAGVASDANGNFIVVWHGAYGQDGSGFGVRWGRFSAQGVSQAEGAANSYTTGHQLPSGVAADANGNFVVVWQSAGQDGSGQGVFGQRFDAFGTPAGGEFQVNAYTTGNQYIASVASDADGDFVVVWQSAGQDGSGDGIFGRRFDAAGVPQGGDFQVNVYTFGQQTRPAVASDPNGDFVIVWRSTPQDGNQGGVFGRRFDASGAPLGSEFQVNSYTTGIQRYPAVASAASGAFVVVWQSNGQDGSGYGVFGQRFNAAGTPLGSEFRVNAYTTNEQRHPRVATDADGNFVVVWGSPQDGNDYGVFGRRYAASGASQGGEFQVNTFTTFGQRPSVVAMNPDGDFVVAWTSLHQDGSGDGVFSQRYGDLIFQDGFESGDLSRWSSAATDGGDLTVGGVGALAGSSSGLQALVDDVNPLYVRDDSPAAENRYRARFYLDPNGFDPGEATGNRRVDVFFAQSATNLRLVTLTLRRVSGAYAVMGAVRRDDGSRAQTAFFGITDGPHLVEFQWRRATGPGANDGVFVLRIDDVPVSTLTGLDNDGAAVEYARLGVMTVRTAAASGTVYLDQFESRQQRLIGPE